MSFSPDNSTYTTPTNLTFQEGGCYYKGQIDRYIKIEISQPALSYYEIGCIKVPEKAYTFVSEIYSTAKQGTMSEYTLSPYRGFISAQRLFTRFEVDGFCPYCAETQVETFTDMMNYSPYVIMNYDDVYRLGFWESGIPTGNKGTGKKVSVNFKEVK